MAGPRIAMVGAGSVVFARTLMSDILSFPELAGANIVLHDVDARRLETAEMMVRSVAATLGARPRIDASIDRRVALRGCDYVINAIQVGGHEATLLDFEIPKKYGLKQTIADTLGIGGIFRALRTIPVLLDICRDMRELCPGALLLNYTNPMAMLCLAVERAGGVPVVGLCHSVQHTSRRLAEYVGVPEEEVWFRVAGINHMAWFLEFRRRGPGLRSEDLYPRLWAALDDPAVYGRDKVRFEMMRRLGFFVTESSEHTAEYVPYFVKRDDLIERFDIPIDEYVRRSARNLGRAEEERARLDRGEPVEVKRSHEFAAYIIRAIEANRDWSFHGNVLNRGLIDNLPADSVVEVPVLVNAAGLQPTRVGALPPQLAALNRTNVNVQQLVVEAALTGSRDHVYHAAMLDPHTAAVLSLDEIWALVDELIEAHGDALPRLENRRLRPAAKVA
ncbi:MAG TPA: alpha-glucosidase/alpha-galactosidase [Chloroflexota bacterium]|nr:alpha-glucosidase/alpha-galactosidase [Chloroflexota bacterium]